MSQQSPRPLQAARSEPDRLAVTLFGVATAVATAILAASAAGDLECGAEGADLAAGDLSGVANYAAVEGLDAVMIGTTFCNLGTVVIPVSITSADHPLATQNLYRLSDGRFEQIGMSWVFNAFAVLGSNACGCGCVPTGSVALFGAGCSYPETAGIMGSSFALSPRSEVNAVTGTNAFPATTGEAGTSVDFRLQFALDDAIPALNPGASYLVEVMVLDPADAAAGNAANNWSYRSVQFSGPATNLNAFLAGSAVPGASAIDAWAAADPEVVVASVAVPDDGTFVVGAKATALPEGGWQYEYAVANLNSDRSAGAFAVPLPIGATLSDVGFHDVAYHSGEPYDGADWSSTREGCVLRWATLPEEENALANALRWGTLYNFRLTSDARPAPGSVRVELFKPGEPAFVELTTVVPGGGAVGACGAVADLDGDGAVNGSDLGVLLGAWGPCPRAATCIADLDGSGGVDGADLGLLLAAWTG
ncbi:MAG: hypothetical protein KDA22_16885 [Phycisphaerales bacterium]|nr:hypothetical protein [Phycisphaerales bacterium]